MKSAAQDVRVYMYKGLDAFTKALPRASISDMHGGSWGTKRINDARYGKEAEGDAK